MDAAVGHRKAAWVAGGSALPLLRILSAQGRIDEAAALARVALSHDPCADRAALRGLLASLSRPPAGWDAALADFASCPSVGAFEDLMRFCPQDVFHQRLRGAIAAMERLGVDPDVVFRCATRWGTTPEAIGMVEEGRVSPEVVVRRGEEGPREARGLWLGFAAQAALARGDRARSVALLSEAFSRADPAFPPWTSIWWIRDRADDDLHGLLDAAGVPRVAEAP